MAPRPRHPRICGCPHRCLAYKPAGTPMGELEQIRLASDELESMRLCDLLGLTQEEAGQSMGVSRGTVQRLLTSARSKVTRALVQGSALLLGDDSCGGGRPGRATATEEGSS